MLTTLYLMVGYPGSGKTTVARYISELTGAQHIWADYERQEMFGKQLQTSQSSKLLYRSLNSRVAQLLTAGTSVIFDTNFRFKRDRDALRVIAAAAGAEVKIIWVNTNKETARLRATVRADNAPNRFFGNISAADFERVTSHFQEPQLGEHPIILHGPIITKSDVSNALNQ